MTPPKQLGRYEILETLGRGAMGVVYKAHDPLIERMVAIKTISYAGLTPDETRDFEQRFFVEAKSAGRLNHPNIVTIHDVGHSNELAYIAMEFLSGQSLRDILDSGVVMPVKRIARIAYNVASGLAFAHANGVVHRDIKPGNIMVLESGHVKITDFGIALLPSGALTMAGTAVGSPKYMAPEQVLGQKADARSDIFSLGAVLYEMLTGTPPFTGADLNAILYQVLNTAPPLPSTVYPSLPEGFDRIVARALAKDPDKRYQNATELVADLRNYKRVRGLLHAHSQDTAPTDKVVKPARTSRRSSSPAPSKPPSIGLRWGMIAATVVALGTGGVYLWPKPPAPVSSIASAVPAAEPKAALTPMAPANTPPAPSSQVIPLAAQAPQAAQPNSAPTKNTAEQHTQAANKTVSPEAARKIKQVKKEADSKTQSKPSPAAPATADEKQPPTDWKAQLRSELAACEPTPFFQRIVCKEKVRWKHCPGHWGTTEDCPRQPDQ